MACINEAKAKAELQVLVQIAKLISSTNTAHFSPIGTQVKRKERAIGIAEDTYRQQLKGIGRCTLAFAKYKNDHR